jgi:hypothetical protein
MSTHTAPIVPLYPVPGVAPTTTSIAPPADSRFSARGDAMTAQPDEPYAAWIQRARSAGHQVLSVGEGRFDPEPLPLYLPTMPPNDLLDAARAYAQAGVMWVHVVVPTMRAAVGLALAIRGPRPTGPAIRRGSPAGVPFPRLVAEQHIGPSAVTLVVNGRSSHAVDLPVNWLECEIGPPA